VREIEGEYQLIWLDLWTIESLASFVSVLRDEFRRYDQRLPVSALSVLAYRCRPDGGDERWDSGRVDAKGDFEDAGQPIATDIGEEPKATAAWLNGVLHALRRGKYILAIDALSEFGSPHPAMDGAAAGAHRRARLAARARELERLCHFLLALARSWRNFGESRLCIATSIPAVSAAAGNGDGRDDDATCRSDSHRS
jgi:hypothetical protein